MVISKKQKEILEYVKNHILTKGFPPAVREICEAVHLKSTSSVHFHLAALEENGFIRRDPTKPRTIEILDDTFNVVRREIIVEQTPTAQNGDIVVALLDDSVTVKRLFKEDGHYRLQPENDSMEPIIVGNVNIQGKAIGLFRQMR